MGRRLIAGSSPSSPRSTASAASRPSIAVDNPAALALMKRTGRVEWAAYDGGAYEVVVALTA